MGFKRRKKKHFCFLLFFVRAFRLPSRPRIGYGALHFGPCEYHIKVTGFEPMALCTQNRCADQTALHLVSPPEHMDLPDRKRLEPLSPTPLWAQGGENHRF